MKVSLKTQTLPITSIVLILIILIPTLTINGLSGLIEQFTKIEDASKLLATLVLTMVIVNLIPFNLRDKLLFLRINHVLPSFRVKELALKDTRFGQRFIEEYYPELLKASSPDSQQAIWWKLYKTSKDKKEVTSAHKNYLIFRDAFSGTLVLLIIALINILLPNLTYLQLPAGILYYLFSCTLMMLVASKSGNRLALNVLSASSE